MLPGRRGLGVCWYNGFIYESDITQGQNVLRFSGQEMAGPASTT